MASDSTQPLLAGEGATFPARALFVGERIDIRPLAPRIATLPLVLSVGERGWAVVFRYGAVILFDVSRSEQEKFLDELRPHISEPYDRPESEPVDIRIDKSRREGFADNAIVLREASLERLQVVAEVLAKSVVLAHYEEAVAVVFASVEPLAEELQRKGRGLRRARELLKQIGGTLMIQHKMVGRVEVTEKPEILWERPELEWIYLLLDDEYELRERHTALERKLSLISNTAETLLELLHAKRSLRVEWYIVLLIVVSILLTLYSMFVNPGGYY